MRNTLSTVRFLDMALIALTILLGTGLPFHLSAQSKKGGKGGEVVDKSRKSGGKGGDVITPASPSEVKTVPTTIYRNVPVKPTKVNLSVAAIPGAQVILTHLSTTRKGSKPVEKVLAQKKIADEDGTLNLVDLPPGTYKVAIEHDDYQRHSEAITVGPGERRTINAAFKLILNHGSIVITGAPPDATVLLDGQAPSKEVDPQGRITIPRVPLGEHVLKVSKEGYGVRERKLEIKPGIPEIFPADLTRLTITLTVRSRPSARVLLNGNFAGIVPAEGALAIPNLDSGDYKLLVSLDGFEDWSRSLKLALSNPKPEVKAELVPIAESGEVMLNAVTAKVSWLPEPAPPWTFERSGVFLVKGELVALLKDPDKRDQFNYYRDFTLNLDLTFQNGKGAAWILRAQDQKNYYLFELTTSKSESGRKSLNFYLCRDGKPILKNSIPVTENIEIPGDSFQLVIEARGNKFTCTLNSAKAPISPPATIGIFTDNTFSIGGVGFQAANGIEMLVRNLHIVPHPGTR